MNNEKCIKVAIISKFRVWSPATFVSILFLFLLKFCIIIFFFLLFIFPFFWGGGVLKKATGFNKKYMYFQVNPCHVWWRRSLYRSHGIMVILQLNIKTYIRTTINCFEHLFLTKLYPPLAAEGLRYVNLHNFLWHV